MVQRSPKSTIKIALGLGIFILFYSFMKTRSGSKGSTSSMKGSLEEVFSLTDPNINADQLYLEYIDAENRYQKRIAKQKSYYTQILPKIDKLHQSTKDVWMAYKPFWYCPLSMPLEMVGDYGQNTKWVCGPRQQYSKCVIYSFGIWVRKFHFEEDLFNLTSEQACSIYVYDPMVTKEETIQQLNSIHPRLKFEPLGLTGSDAINEISVSGNAYKATSLQSLMASHNHKCIDILKLDVENFEHEILEQWYSAGDGTGSEFPCIRQLLIEFHILSEKSHIQRSMDILEAMNYRMVNSELNAVDPKCTEFTFIRYDPEIGYY